jgi:quercetin dioxygenase-like cupin family protein
MNIKRNEATANRPAGDRVIDAPYVFSDITSYIKQLKEEKAWEKNDRNSITVFKAGNITVVITALHSGAEITGNKIDGFISIQVLEGKTGISTPDGDIIVAQQQMVVFHPGITHSIKALSDCILLLTSYVMD